MKNAIRWKIRELSYEYDAIDRDLSELKMKLSVVQARRDALTEKMQALMAQEVNS